MTPSIATIRLTTNCNARCVMCNVWQQPKEELDISLLGRLPAGLRQVNLSGGETFLRDDLASIVRKIRKACPKIRQVILTNGILLERITGQIKSILREDPHIGVRVSIDGLALAHDSMRGIDGAYIKAIETIRFLKKTGLRDLGLIVTVSDRNADNLKAVYELARQERVKFSFQAIHSSDFYYHKYNPPLSLSDTLKVQIKSIVADELKSLSLHRLGKAYYYSELMRIAQGGQRAYPCPAAKKFFYLRQNGLIYPCFFLNTTLGNLAEHKFDDIWHSAQAEEVRKKVLRCTHNCWLLCTAAPVIKNNPFSAAEWILINKLKAHLRKPNFLWYRKV